MPDNPQPTIPPVPAPAPVPQPPARQTSTMNASKAWGWAKDALVILVIPLFLWGVKLEVGNAKRDKELEYQAEKIENLQEDLDEAQDIDKGVQANALKLVQLEGKLDTANGRLDDIKDLLLDR